MGLQNFLMNRLIENSVIGKKIQSGDNVSKKGQFALDATEKNPNIEDTMAEKIANLENETKRLDNSVKKVISLPNGASTGDGQIEDAKVGIEGESYDTLGDAIREQVKTYRDVDVSNTTPTNKAKVWVNTSTNDTESQDILLPQVDDANISEENTWSSKKISEIKEGVDWVLSNFQQGIVICVNTIDTTSTDDTSFPNIDTFTKTITFPIDYSRLYMDGTPIKLSGLSLHYTSGNSIILFNKETGELEDYDFTYHINDLAVGRVYIGCIIDNNVVHMNIEPYYFVNGVKCNKSDAGYINLLHSYPVPQWKWNMSVLGDSISTFDGITETTVDNNQVKAAYYPHIDETNSSKSVTTSDQMWWSILAKELRISTEINVSAVSQSSFKNQNDPAIPPLYVTERISNLSKKTFPNIIFINAGTNDAFFSEIGEFGNSWDISKISKEQDTVTRGIELTIRKIQKQYQYTKIVVLIPKVCNGSEQYESQMFDVCDRIAQISKKYGVWKIIDLRKCGITKETLSSYTFDGIHPNKSGMKLIARYIANCLFNIDN